MRSLARHFVQATFECLWTTAIAILGVNLCSVFPGANDLRKETEKHDTDGRHTYANDTDTHFNIGPVNYRGLVPCRIHSGIKLYKRLKSKSRNYGDAGR